MATTCVARVSEDTKDDPFYLSKNLRISRTGWVECDGACSQQTRAAGYIYARVADWRSHELHTASSIRHVSTPTLRYHAYSHDVHVKASALVADLLRSLDNIGRPYLQSLPEDGKVEAAVYDQIEDCVHVQLETPPSAPNRPSQQNQSSTSRRRLGGIDLDDMSGFQERMGKKTKKQQATTFSWNDPDPDGGAAPAGGGEDTGEGANNGTGDTGSGAGGNDNGDNGKGDDGDDWNAGGKKGKKNNKKKAKEEEDKKKQEEEEAKRKKEEEEAAAAAIADPLSWADDSNVANGEDEWSSTFTKKDKKKKGKKGAEEEITTTTTDQQITNAFQDISLDDSPKLDFSFGALDSKKEPATGFSWGKSWDFGGTGTTDKVDDKKKDKDKKETTTDFAESNPWSMGNKSKKKTTISTGFDFGEFGPTTDFTFDGDVGGKQTEEDSWGFTATGKKDKKKKSELEETKEEPVVEESAAKEEDTWGGWGAAPKKNSKAKKKGAFDDEPPPPPPAPVAALPDLPEAEETWSAFTTTKDKKKKGKKGAIAEEPIVEAKTEDILDLGDTSTGFDWAFGSKKDKKDKETKLLVMEVKDDPPAASEPAKDDPDDWQTSGWGTAKTKAKKGKKGAIEELPLDTSTAADTKSQAGESNKEKDDDGWGAFTTTKGKKDKKGKKTAVVDEPPPPPPPPEADPPAEETDIWASLGKKDKKGKKGKGTTPEPSLPDGIVEPEPVPEPESELLKEDDSFSMFGLAGKEKKKREKEAKKKEKEKKDEKKEPEPEPEEEPEPVIEKKEEKNDDIWGTWGSVTKDKKGKDKEVKRKAIGSAAKQTDPEHEAEPEVKPIESKEDDIWNFGSKDKKKAAKDTKKKGAAEETPKAPEKTEPAVEEDTWGMWGTKDKKSSKKSKGQEDAPPANPSPPAQGLSPEATALDALNDDFADDNWAGLTAVKPKTTGKKSTTTSTIKATSTKDKLKKGKEVAEDIIPKEEPIKEEAEPVEETPAKATKSFWGSFGTTAASTPKLTKKEKEAKEKKEAEEKAKKEAEEQAEKEEEERLAREAEEAEAEAKAAEEAAKAEAEKAKSSKKSKASKTSSKTTGKTVEKIEEKKKEEEEPNLLDMLDEPIISPKSDKASTKLKKTSTKEEKTDDKKADDYFGFWGSGTTSKKTTGKKDTDSKKEITKQESANQDEALPDLSKDLELDRDEQPLPSSKAATSKTMLSGKNKPVSSGLAARIKAFEDKKEDSGKKTKTDSLLTKESAELEPTLSPKEEKKESSKASSSKTKSSTIKDSRSSKKQDDIPIIPEEKRSKDSVPGSFPGAFGDEDEDILALDLAPLSPEKPKVKTSKVDKAKEKEKDKKKSAKEKPATPKESKANDLDLLDESMEVPEIPEPSKLPTPPPEGKKSAKKERPKVDRVNTSSWGFWGATPPPKKAPKEKAKDDAEISPPASKTDKSPTGLSRSKSTRTPREKEAEDKKEAEKSKSSGSDHDATIKKSASKPSKPSRSTGFSNFMFGGPPPSAMRPQTARRPSTGGNSRPASRRQSVDQIPLSPPSERELEVDSKAAKITGGRPGKVSRSSSMRGKPKAVPDPYPIDDDDVVMIHDGGNLPAVSNTPVKDKSKSKSSRSKSKYDAKSPTKSISQEDDAIMVESAHHGDPLVTSGPDDMAFVDHPPSLKRSNTAKKAAGFFGSLFGMGYRASDPDVGRSRSITLSDAEEHGLPVRTRESSRRKSRAVDVDEFTTDAPVETDADAEARRAERRARREARIQAEETERVDREKRRRDRREREKADLEARQERARELARQEQEAEEQRREEKRARRAAREARRAQEDFPEPSPISEKRRDDLHRSRTRESGLRTPVREERSRGAYLTEEDERRRRKDEQRSRDRVSSGRKKSTPMVAEYHDSRNGKKKGQQPPSNKASSWVHSQQDDPPEMPLIEPTILDPSGEKPRAAQDDDSHDTRKGSHRHHRDKYTGMTEAEIEERRAQRRSTRRVERDHEREATVHKSASGGSDEKDRRPRRKQTYNEDYDAYPVTFDGRPALARAESKRNSFMSKWF